MWPNPQETADLVILTEEILNENFQFLCSDFYRRDLTSAEKSHPSPDDFKETFALNLIKQNVTNSHIQKYEIIPVCIGIKMLPSFQMLTRPIKK